MTDRPIECAHCKKPANIIYKEIAEGTINQTEMCDTCPLLQQKMGSALPEIDEKTDWVCGHCHTSFEEILRGEPLGCPDCYSVFKTVLIDELISRGEVPLQVVKKWEKNKNGPLHIGSVPGETTAFTLSSQLSSLNTALQESLRLENYEQAAWLRDQIKSLKDNPKDE